MRTSSSKLLTALVKRYEAQIAEGEATLQVYLTNAAGIGEHPQIVDEMDKQVEQIAAAEDRLLAITKFIANNKED
jgi:hypothetical protein